MLILTKIITIFLIGAVVGEEFYSEKYDYVDVDGILANPRLRNQYYKCFAGEGPCLTADAKFYKENLPEAIVTKCRKCTARQAINFDKLTDWYTINEPKKYENIVRKAIEKITGKKTT